jgi:hypothetical protein
MESRQNIHLFARPITQATAAIVLAAFVLVAPSMAQESVAIPGTSVTLTPPAGFTVSRAGRGLENDAGSTITISERSAESYAELAQTFGSARNLSAAYAEQGVTIRAVRQFDTPAGPVQFAGGSQSNKGRELTKYFALLKGDKTVLVTFSMTDRSFSDADAEAVVRSVVIAPAATIEEQLAGLPFTFRIVEPFRVTRVVGRNTVTLEAGEGGAASTRPAIVIGRGESQAVMGDESRVAVELLRNTGGFREATITAQGPVPFAGGAGYRVSAVVEDRTVVQYLRIVPGGAYLRFLARGPTSAIQSAETTIAAVAASVEPQ